MVACVASSSTHALCVGDCNEDGSVRVDELVRAVQIALTGQSPSQCPSLDQNENNVVSVDELVAAVASNLTNCTPRPVRTPTPTPSPTVSQPSFRVCGCVDEFTTNSCGQRGYIVTLNPLGLSTSPDTFSTTFCFEHIPAGDYTLTLSIRCNPSGCWPDETPISVVDRDVSVRISIVSTPVPTALTSP